MRCGDKRKAADKIHERDRTLAQISIAKIGCPAVESRSRRWGYICSVSGVVRT